MSHLQANLRTSELLSSVLFGVPECLLLTVLFVSKAADRWVVVDGLLSWYSFHFTGSKISLKMVHVSRNMSL
jgi:hypothetical protein